LKKTSYSF